MSKLPNPIEMEHVIRAAGWLYCGAGIWRHQTDKDARSRPFPPYDRVALDEAYRRQVRMCLSQGLLG